MDVYNLTDDEMAIELRKIANSMVPGDYAELLHQAAGRLTQLSVQARMNIDPRTEPK